MKKTSYEPKRSNGTDVKTLTPTELMMAYKGGNTAAFDELYRRFKPRLDYWMRASIQSPQDREDIIHNCFVALVRFAHHYRPTHKFSTWFYTVAKNQISNFFRVQKQTVSLNKYDDSPDRPTIEIEDKPGLSQQMDELENIEIIRRYVEVSDSKFSHIVNLRDLEGFTYEEIIQITGLPMGTVKSRLYRGRKELKILLS